MAALGLLVGGRAPAQVAAMPEPAAAIRAFHDVRTALVEGDPSGVSGVGESAVHIMLRLDGRVIARGSAVGEGALASATKAARAEIDAALARAASEADALRARESLRLSVLSLELGGAEQSLDVATFADADAKLPPGLVGVVVRRADRIEAAFPGTMLLSGKTPGDALAGCVAVVVGDASAPIRGTARGEAGALAEAHRLAYGWFPVLHLVQSRADEQPWFAYRGGRVVSMADVSSAGLRTFERALAEHLQARVVRTPARLVGEAETCHFLGTYQPVTGRADPEMASPTDQALAAMALCRYAAHEPDRLSAAGALGTARAVLISLTHNEGSVWDRTAASAAWVLAARALMDADPTATIGDADTLAKIDARLAASFTPERGWAPDVPEHERGVIACALAARALDADESARAQACVVAREAVRSLFRDTAPARLVVHMPWLILAESYLVGDGDWPSAPALREFRARVWDHQGASTDLADQADMAGGIVFPSSGNPYPTWFSIRPLAGMALMLGDDRLTDRDQTLREVSRLVAGLRFVRQLALDRDTAYIAVEPRRALFGVRLALWDPRQSLEASAMALWTVTESRRGLERATSRMASPAAP
ncbi:MAG: hypothetical protein HBSAPP03_02090 [Phycisphaerae bacterium]|nr:MAG: hypothetical protein HBSAPP03_02090 [Phycisphaerae bacterium]